MLSTPYSWKPLAGAFLGMILILTFARQRSWSETSQTKDRNIPGQTADLGVEQLYGSPIRDGLREQPTSKPSISETSYSAPAQRKEYTQSLVVASVTSDDTSWISDNLPNLLAYIYVADDPTATYHPPENKGREATMYLTHIIDHYDNLTDVVIFIHAHQEAWHNNDLFNFNMAEMLKMLRPQHVVETALGGYFNLRCHPESGCPAVSIKDSGHFDYSHMDRNFLKETWKELHGASKELPASLSAMCCAQFAVSKEAIRRTSKEQWIKYRDWLLTTDLPDDISGRIWEFTWHYVLSGHSVQCPNMYDCYCHGYGLCFEGGIAQIDAMLGIKETLFLAEERLKDMESSISDNTRIDDYNRRKGDTEWHVVQKLRRVLDTRKDIAIVRGKRVHGEEMEF